MLHTQSTSSRVISRHRKNTTTRTCTPLEGKHHTRHKHHGQQQPITFPCTQHGGATRQHAKDAFAPVPAAVPLLPLLKPIVATSVTQHPEDQLGGVLLAEGLGLASPDGRPADDVEARVVGLARLALVFAYARSGGGDGSGFFFLGGSPALNRGCV